MRQLILDTETTGLDTRDGHRITEIGIVEVLNQIPTGRTYHQYINPQREVGEDSVRITGLTNEMLADKPIFSAIVDDFVAFIGDAPIVAHNATFDMNFLQHEMTLCDRAPLENEVIDTLAMARKKFPGSRHSLDALCQRFDVDGSKRTLHGALLDAELLAEVYIELTGGRQANLLGGDAADENKKDDENTQNFSDIVREHREPRPHLGQPTADEMSAHKSFITGIDGSLWREDSA